MQGKNSPPALELKLHGDTSFVRAARDLTSSVVFRASSSAFSHSEIRVRWRFVASLTFLAGCFIHHIGAGMGAVGTMRKVGKVAGPILGGALLAVVEFESMLWAVAAFPLAAAAALGVYRCRNRGAGARPARFEQLAG